MTQTYKAFIFKKKIILSGPVMFQTQSDLLESEESSL